MSVKSHTSRLLIITCAVLLGSYFLNVLLPISIETKQSLGYPRESFLNFTQLSAQHGYISKEHTVETEDGYLLKMFRMEGKNCKGKKRKPPVILMHGLLQSSDIWLVAGPNAGLAYLLADACYDLWVGNNRGNHYSRTHKTLNSEDAEFWRFSVDEIGFYDIPAMINYVIDYTGSEKVNHIGFSQGSGTFYIMCSERPEMCDKVNLHIGLAPASRHTYTKSVLFRLMITTFRSFWSIFVKAGMHEVFAKGGLSQEFMAFFCQCSRISNSLCGSFEALLDSSHPESITKETTSILFGHYPVGTSAQNLARYGQSLHSENFEKFDYGREKNLRLYGSERPPLYNLSAVTAPVVIIYGKNDYLVDPEDVRWLIKKLPNVLEAEEVKNPLWNHLDVTFSQFTKELIFPKVNEYLMKYCDVRDNSSMGV